MTQVGKCIAVTLTILSVTFAARAGEFVIGRYAGEFLSLGAGARALAMGNAAIAAPTFSTAGYYNPSALSGLDRTAVEFMHASQFDNLFTYDYLSFARPMENGVNGAVTLLYTRVGDIPLTKLSDPNQGLSDNNRVIVDKSTGDHELAILASAGRHTVNGWKIGGSAKLLSKAVADASAFGLGIDLGAGRSIAKGMDIGFVARDITTSVLAWSTGRTEAILPSVVAGGAWTKYLAAVNAKLTLVADLEGHFESRGGAETIDAGPVSIEPHAGLEYLISNTVALRGGMSGEHPTAGAGLSISRLSVNASFQDHEDLGFTHRISVALGW